MNNVTPDLPVQGGFAGIASGGDPRNHYDFIDCEIDGQGRVLASYTLGCTGSCPQNGGPNSFQTIGAMVRQSGGRRMLAQFDPQEPAVAQPPLINGYRTAQFVSLNWPPADGSGLPVTGYNVYRSIDGGAETRILSAITQRQIVLNTDPTKSYSYRVTALNTQGESDFSNAFAPTVGQNAPRPDLSCTVPGQLYFDRIGEGAAFPNNDIASFGISEPANMPGKLVFTVNNAQPQAVANGESDFYVFFDPPRGGISYRLNLTAGQVQSYRNGQITGCGTGGLSECRGWQNAGALDPASGIQPDGSVRLVINKATYGILTGDVLLSVFIREDTVGNPSRILASDFAGGRQNYTVVGNDFCTTALTPTSVVSRKTHGSAGFFDILLPLAGGPGIECRTGGASGDHQVVFNFAVPVTFSSASTTAGTVASTSTMGNSVLVNLTGVPNAQTITVTLTGVNTGTTTGNVSVPMGVLLGDTTPNGMVNSSDIGLTKSNSGQTTNGDNFRTDVTVNGTINSSDIGTVKAQSGTNL